MAVLEVGHHGTVAAIKIVVFRAEYHVVQDTVTKSVRSSTREGKPAMPSRYLPALIVVSMILGSMGLAHAQADDERRQMLIGGAPRKSNFNFFGFGGSDATLSRVSYSGREAPGTIIVNTAERKLYLVQEGGNALRYAIGVGRAGFQWKGIHRVSAKKEWPTWTPAEVSASAASIPRLPHRHGSITQRHLAPRARAPLGWLRASLAPPGSRACADAAS